MIINNFSIDFKNNILIITSENGVKEKDIPELKTIVEETMEKIYNYVMYRDGLGYYHCWDYLKNDSVYCATLNKTYAIKLINKYINEK